LSPLNHPFVIFNVEFVESRHQYLQLPVLKETFGTDVLQGEMGLSNEAGAETKPVTRATALIQEDEK